VQVILITVDPVISSKRLKI